MTRRKERPKRPKKPRKKRQPERRELELVELEAIVERAKAALSTEDHEQLKAAVDTLAFITRELESKRASIKRLQKLLFGAGTEKTSKVVGGASGDGAADAEGGTGGSADGATGGSGSKGKGKCKRKGHGRRGAQDYHGAEKVKVPHESLQHKDPCPACQEGKVYKQREPAVLVRVTGMAPLRAKVYERERLRCHLCGKVFTARSPPGVGEKKYDETAAAMIGLLKYGCGLPFNRIERLQQNLGIPLPAATQWELVDRTAEFLAPAHDELVRQAGQGEVLHNDDTTMRILEVAGRGRPEEGSNEKPDERTGLFTSGIVSTGAGRRIALFFTGVQHAGENLSDVLARRGAELSTPIQMCDALSRNTTGEFETILAHCIAHARRRFVEVADSFPDECRHVLETLREVYKNDAVAREEGMSPEERLRFHQAESSALMNGLEQWCREQIDERKVEPNSGLGEAIGYMRKHWQELTLFLREPGAPLDNNLCERALKKAILHRKNSLFYRTENGARVGDLFMGLIHTAELNGVDPFDYLVTLQRRHREVARDPGEWMPWNYRTTLARLAVEPL
ncbi:MAG: IS66 family transposase [Myxococcota bacterium]